MIDAMAYRGFSKARVVDVGRMNQYVRQTFSLS
jgi:DNA-directed RNA polymerase subunit H (RpoH/RPB5)